MKKNIIIFFLLITINGGALFAQKLPVVGVMVFDVYGAGVTPAEAVSITNRIVSELNSWGTLSAAQGSAGAEYIIHGTIARQGNSYVLSGVTSDADSGRALNEYKEQIEIDNISLFSFCAKAAEKVPFPNYLLGTWQSSINMPDGPVVCIIEFKSDRTTVVERYDTWEYRQGSALRYEGYGSGAYTYAGYANRVVNVNSQQMRIDAAVGINLKLEETLPEQTSVNQTGLFLVFNADKNAFNIANGSLPCGRNYDGQSVYPSANLGFINFTKIR